MKTGKQLIVLMVILLMSMLLLSSSIIAFAEEGEPLTSKDIADIIQEVKDELSSENLLSAAEILADTAKNALDEVEGIVTDADLQVVLDKFGDPAEVDEDNIEDAVIVVDAAGNAVDEANTAIAAAEEAVEKANGAIELAKKALNAANAATDAANDAITAANDAEEEYQEALENSADQAAIAAAEATMIEKRATALVAQQNADKAEAAAKDVAWAAFQEAIDAYVAAIAAYETALEADTDVADAAQAKLAAENAIVTALNAQMSGDKANMYAQKVIETANNAVGYANEASTLAGELIIEANGIIAAVENYIIEEIFMKAFDDMTGTTYDDYLKAYYKGVSEVANLYGISGSAGFNTATATVEELYVEINILVEQILKYNEAAYAEYQKALALAEAAYNRALVGKPEPTSSAAIYSSDIILQVFGSTATGDGPYQGSGNSRYNGRFTDGFKSSFVDVLLAYWEENNIHQDLTDDELMQKAQEIASGKALNMGTASNAEFYKSVNTSNLVKVGDNYIYTMQWGTSEGVGLDKQQVIAVDWYVSGSPTNEVVSYIFILDGKYSENGDIKLIFTPEMYATLGANFVVKRIAYSEDFTEVMLESLKALPEYISVVPTLGNVAFDGELPPFIFGAIEGLPTPTPDPDPDPEGSIRIIKEGRGEDFEDGAFYFKIELLSESGWIEAKRVTVITEDAIGDVVVELPIGDYKVTEINEDGSLMTYYTVTYLPNSEGNVTVEEATVSEITVTNYRGYAPNTDLDPDPPGTRTIDRDPAPTTSTQTITEDSVPLANAPSFSNTPVATPEPTNTEIIEDNVPLGGLPQTGDNLTPVQLSIVLLIVSLVGMGVLVRAKRRGERAE